MHPEVVRFVKREGATSQERRFQASVTAFLRSFVQGEDFDDDEIMKQTRPTSQGIWEFRITFEPQHRVFGGFLRKGEFVALAHQNRKALDVNGFAPTRTRAISLWTSLFPAMSPLVNVRRKVLLEDYEHADL